MMKAIFTLILLLSSASAFAGDYEDGMFACMLRDHTTAIAKLKKPAEQGDVKAQVCLGEMYSTGESGLRDYEQAVYWYTKAAEQGHWEAQYWLGTMYEKGQGVPKDYEQAFYWYTKGAE
jgi:uncharacterized protein